MRRFGLLILCLLLGWCGGCGSGDALSPRYTTVVSGTRIALSDTNLFFSPYNWSVEGTTTAVTAQSGAYLAASFQSANVRLNIDTSFLSASPNRSGPVIRWQVDSGATHTYQLAAGDVQIPLNSNTLAAGMHTCKVWFVAADYKQDRWKLPLEALRVTGLTLDAGGVTVAPTLLTKRVLFFGDSIAEGVRTESAHGDPTRDDDSTHAFPYNCAAALNAEFGVVGVARQGWTIPGEDGSNVPNFITAWTFHYTGKSRAFTPAPDYAVVMHGVNDALSPADPNQVKAAVQGWMVAARAAMPSSRLCVVVPFNGFEREAITQAVQAYKAAHGSDTNVFLIDLGVSVQTGLTDPSGAPSQHSHDGIHPDAATSEALGTKLAAALTAAAP
ncbi:MAG: lysophospholipase L1-like esterase [Chthonomonadaceae bacterium]|nr:lysophospholipase L1-like esterase [Chthonomonadaceae bacterium]